MAHACAAIYFLNLRGDILIERRYRDDVERDMAENFRTQVINSKERGSSIHTPVRTLGSVTFMYMRHNDVYVLMVTRNNANAMMAFKFMSSLVDLLRSYFDAPVDEAAVKRNFVLIYELLDETMDWGLPQLTEPASLKACIFEKGVRSEIDRVLGRRSVNVVQQARAAQNATLTVTGAVSWRREGIRYKRNEVFLDVVEEVNLLMSAQGVVLRCDVVGRLLMKCCLSDMPELRLGLSEAPDDSTFHQCVNLAAYEAQKVVTFVPPDGEFELLRYRSAEAIGVPFKIVPLVKELGRTRVEAVVSIRANFAPQLFALSVTLLVPVPEYTAKAAITVSTGKAKYDAAKKALVWKIKRFTGGAEHTLRAEVTLVSTTKTRKPWARAPISCQFQVPMLSASSLRVSYLKIHERRLGPAYKVDKWVRKMCKSGDYLVRI